MPCNRATTTLSLPPWSQGRADWGLTLDTIARTAGLGFLPVQDEQYDFIVPKARIGRPAVAAFVALLRDPSTEKELERRGMRIRLTPDTKS